MSTAAAALSEPFVDRRDYTSLSPAPVGERRQFTNSYHELSPEAARLATAIDQYKLHHRRRFINYEEMLMVIKSLGYRKDTDSHDAELAGCPGTESPAT
jgi:hypothetical protein